MKRNTLKSAWVSAGVALFLSATPTFAVIETIPIAFGSSAYPEMLSLPEFNTSLGNLTDISISLMTTATLQSDIINLGPATTFTGAIATGTMTLSGLTGASLSTSLATVPFDGAVGAGTIASPVVVQGAAATLTGFASAHIASADFAAYEYPGVGSPAMPFDANFLAGAAGTGPSGLFFGDLASADGFVEVSYTYTPASVPESATVWAGLCALGCCGLTMLVRLRPFRL